MTKRTMRINFNDGKFFDMGISKATSVRTQKEMIHLDKLEDGTWRLIFNPNLIEDFSTVKNFEMIRED